MSPAGVFRVFFQIKKGERDRMLGISKEGGYNPALSVNFLRELRKCLELRELRK